MATDNKWVELQEQTKTLAVYAISNLLDSGYLALWVVLQWLMDTRVFSAYKLSGLDTWFLYGFQILFAISTFVPIAIIYYGDITILLVRTHERIMNEIARSRKGREKKEGRK